jgi:hypothetical protein
MTIKLGASVRITSGPSGKIGTVTSTNGYIVGMEMDNGATVPLYAT